MCLTIPLVRCRGGVARSKQSIPKPAELFRARSMLSSAPFREGRINDQMDGALRRRRLLWMLYIMFLVLIVTTAGLAVVCFHVNGINIAWLEGDQRHLSGLGGSDDDLFLLSCVLLCRCLAVVCFHVMA